MHPYSTRYQSKYLSWSLRFLKRLKKYRGMETLELKTRRETKSHLILGTLDRQGMKLCIEKCEI
jgi:hypothetical protein